MDLHRVRHILAASLLALPVASHAQAIRGTVADERAAPVAGVIVLLRDSASAVVARTLSNARGEFRLTAPRDGSFRVHTQRIGFRPSSYGPYALSAGAEVTQRLTLTGLPVQLANVTVVGQNVCRSVAVEGTDVHAVWEQARAALTVAQMTATMRGNAATTLVYERVLEPSGRIREQNSSIRATSAAQPWRSLSSDSLRAVGYVIANRDGSVTYHAPDLEALLSDTFLEDHCFRIAPKSNADRVGITFEPTPARRRVAEIAGTLWLDRKTSELRTMEFGYANVAVEREDQAGGALGFARTASGGLIISRWEIRMPILERRAAREGATIPGASASSQLHVTAIKVNAGELLMIRQGADTLWARPPMVLTATVVDSSSAKPVPGARIRLRGTALSATTDASGRLTLPDVLPGAYTVEVRTPSLDSVGVVHTVGLAFTEAATGVRLRAPSAANLAAGLCSGDQNMVRSSRREARGLVAGSILGPQGSAGDSAVWRGATIVAEWDADPAAAGMPPGSAGRTEWLTTVVDSRGQFRICGVPVNATLTLRAESDSGSSATVQSRIPAGRGFTHALLTIDSAGNHGAVLMGLVLNDSTRLPMPNVRVALPALGMSAVTNDAGGFRIGSIPEGTHQVVARSTGYAPLDTRMTFVANRTLERRIFLSSATVLAPVVVTAERDDMFGFEENRRQGVGYFFTRAELAKHEGRRLSEVLGRAPGAKVVASTGNQMSISTDRGTRSVERMQIGGEADLMEGHKAGICFSQVYIDRILVYAGRKGEPPFDINTIPVASIEAIEFYSGPAQTPGIYLTRAPQCGVLVVHTRRPP